MFVCSDFRKLGEKFLVYFLSLLLFFSVRLLRFIERDFGRGFVASAARRDKYNRGQEGIGTKRRDKFRRRNFG